MHSNVGKQHNTMIKELQLSEFYKFVFWGFQQAALFLKFRPAIIILCI